MPSKFRIETGSATDTGRIRSENQDRCGAFNIDDPPITGIIVADGMGGHSGGSTAAEIAVKEFETYLQSRSCAQLSSAKEIPVILKEAFDHIYHQMVSHADAHPEQSGMGTTLSVALIHEKLLYSVHVGDSRIYRFNSKSRMQISRDHSMVQEMVNQGLLTSEQARNHPDDNVLIRALTAKVFDAPDIYAPVQISRGDTFLVCSDGLWKMIPDDILHKSVCGVEAQEAADTLVDMANKQGGEDNISVSIMRVL